MERVRMGSLVSLRSLVHLLGLVVLAQIGQSSQPTTKPSLQPADNSAAPAPQIHTILQGQVVDELGRGVENVEVAVAKLADTTVTGNAKSDSFGDFQIKIVGPHPGKFQVTAAKQGFTERTIQLEIPQEDLEPFVDITLTGSLAIVGQVVDFAAARPIGQAVVRLQTLYRTATTQTDETGHFEFKDLIPTPAQLIIEAEGFGKRRVAVEVKEQAAPLRIALKPERILHLTILDDHDQPVTGAAVELEVAPPAPQRTDPWNAQAPGVAELEVDATEDYRDESSDSAGRVVFRGLPYNVQEATARITHRDFVSTGRFDQPIPFPPDGAETRHTLHLLPAAIIRGTITRADSGEPLNGVRIDIGARLDYSTPHAFSNIAGEYRVGSLSPGPSVVTVSASGFAPQIGEVVARPRDSVALDFQLRPGRRISGRVLDEQGQPVRGASIEAMKWQNYETLGLATLSDAEGDFTIASAPLEEFRMDISASGHAPLTDQLIAADRNSYQFELHRASEADLARSAPQRLAKVGDPCPPLKLTTLKGLRIDQTTSKGKLILLDFWATWCPPCVAELPKIKRIHDSFGKRDDFMLVGVSSDFERSALERFIETRQFGWHHVFGPDSGAEEISAALGVTAIPCTVLVGKDGKIMAVDLPVDQLHNQIKAALESDAK